MPTELEQFLHLEHDRLLLEISGAPTAVDEYRQIQLEHFRKNTEPPIEDFDKSLHLTNLMAQFLIHDMQVSSEVVAQRKYATFTDEERAAFVEHNRQLGQVIRYGTKLNSLKGAAVANHILQLLATESIVCAAVDMQLKSKLDSRGHRRLQRFLTHSSLVMN